MALRHRGAAATGDEPIAIVGASCRFPGADGLDEFWQLLIDGGDAVSEVDPQRWATRFFYHPEAAEPGKSYTWAAGLIEGVDRFEPSFFGISPREAVQMDPQQRLLLELVWHAFEDAGVPPSRVRASDIGVYIGASATDYSDLAVDDPAVGDASFMTGNALSILANRISYVFDLRGPSLTIDTACSSSLVALHQACEAIRNGQIPSAIVGGVNLLLTPYPFLGFCRASMLSHRGRCFAFDARADGYVRSEGAGVVILKPLADALANHDPIRALILATGCNSDGRTIGLSLPSEAAQAALLTSLYRDADVAADDITFFEMHGTGTPVGDPVEAAAVGHSIGVLRQNPLLIGSVKTNIGHLEPASGMAGLLKAVLALEQGVVPPTLHCEEPNPKIDFSALNLRLVLAPEAIAVPRQRRIAGVNSFGFGGTNAHAVLAATPQCDPFAPSLQSLPLLISAATQASLRELAQGWRSLLARTSDERTPGLLRAAARGRDHHCCRLAVSDCDRAATVNALDCFLADDAPPELVAGSSVQGARLAFVFCGNGAQYPAMGRAALQANGAFRDAIEELDRLLRPELGWSVLEQIESGVDALALARADVAQPLLFAIQIGIVKALRTVGIVAEGHIGHSVGEIAAAWSAGALSLADAARIVIVRSRSQQLTQGTGRMAALALGDEAANEFLAEIDSRAELAAFNAPQSVTVSGTGEEIERLVTAADHRGLWCRRLDLDFAFHSRLMEPAREPLLRNLACISSQRPSARLMSTVTGTAIETGGLDAGHWWRNVRDPVRFSDAIAAMIGEGFGVFVEIGPTPILRSYLAEGLRAAAVEGRVLSSLRKSGGDKDPFLATAAECYVGGYDWSPAPCFDGDTELRGLPLYRWDRQRYWLDKTVEAAGLMDPPFDHPLLGFRQHGHWPCWRNHLSEHVLSWISDHSIEGIAVYPAAAVIETALAAARWRWPDAPVLEVAEVEIQRPLLFDNGRLRELRMTLTSDDGDWELASRPRLSNDPMSVHAVGRIAAASRISVARAPIETAATGRMDGDSLYHLAGQEGLNYARCFRTVSSVEVFGRDRAVIHLDPTAIDEALDAYLLHPALLDGALQGVLALLALSGDDAGDTGLLPWRCERVRLAAPFGRVCRRAHLELTRVGTRSAALDLTLFDQSGDVVAALTGCWLRRVELSRRDAASTHMFHVDLIPVPLVRDRAPPELFAPGRLLARIAAARTPVGERCEEGVLLDAMIAAAGLRVWQALVKPGERFTLTDLIAQGRVSAAAAGLAECLLRAIERLGGATEVDGQWRIESETDLPDAVEIWRMLLADAPELVGELAGLAAALDRLPQVLVNGLTAQAPPAAMVDALLRASPATSVGIDALGDAVAAIAADWPPDRSLRILEIGADSAGTARFLHRLAGFPARLVYLATSDDSEQIDRLAAITRPFAGAAACRWTLGEACGAIGDERFDIILTVNSCARLNLDARLLATVAELIVPGGLFLAVEPAPNLAWDIVFGQSASWWITDRSGNATSRLRSSEEWQAELAAAGFCNAEAVPLVRGPWPVLLLWGSVPLSACEAIASAPAQSRAIAVIAEDGALRRTLSGQLNAAGHLVTVAEPEDQLAALHQIAAHAELPGAVIFLAGTGDAGKAPATIAALARIAHAAAEHSIALWVVTTDAQQPATGGIKATLSGAGVWGMARVLTNELPQLAVRSIDIAGGSPSEQQARQIAAEIAAATLETEIVWTPYGRHVLRLRSGLPPYFAPREQALNLVGGPSSGLDSLEWAASEGRRPSADEVEIEVRAAGLNFRDVMWAMGLLPEEALIDGFTGANFGLECAGVVVAIGADVESLRIGDRVMALAPAALGKRVFTVADGVAPIPASLGFAAAATLPVAFMTAIYALGHLAQLEPEECVLIHAAAGGVGLAAIQYAKHRGATIIATASTSIKRRFVKLAGADHVVDARDPAFVDAVREITGGKGVDAVLNSSSDEVMERSFEVLKPFGRFLELGKRAFYQNRRLRLRPLRHNISYFVIDIDELPRHRPALARILLREVSVLLADRAIRPLAHRMFYYSQIDEAFRLMRKSTHIGKLVLIPDADEKLQLRRPPDVGARRDGTYLVTGGIEGFGFEAARWLAKRGAGAIALLARRGEKTPQCTARVAELEAAGAVVRVFGGDVVDRAALATVLSEIRATLPPLVGVVHAASTIDDRLTSDLDAECVGAALRPKLGGAWALHELTRDDPIELFLLFSSATTLLGAPGQGAYIAANSALEALARQRHAEGRPALAVGWGPIADAGYLARHPQLREALARRLGAIPLTAAQALEGLPEMLASGLPVVAAAAADWEEAQRALPLLASPLFSEIGGHGRSSAAAEAIGERLRRLDPDAARGLIETLVAEAAERILRLPPGRLNRARPLSELGMDSLMTVELRLALAGQLRIDLPLLSLADGTSAASIAARLAGVLAEQPPEADLAAVVARHEPAVKPGSGRLGL